MTTISGCCTAPTCGLYPCCSLPNKPHQFAPHRKVATNNRVQLDRGECFEDFVLFDCVFGIPLFDEALNKSICQRVLAKRLLAAERFVFVVHRRVGRWKKFNKVFLPFQPPKHAGSHAPHHRVHPALHWPIQQCATQAAAAAKPILSSIAHRSRRPSL
jgi:hypothetical protein